MDHLPTLRLVRSFAQEDHHRSGSECRRLAADQTKQLREQFLCLLPKTATAPRHDQHGKSRQIPEFEDRVAFGTEAQFARFTARRGVAARSGKGHPVVKFRTRMIEGRTTGGRRALRYSAHTE